MHAIYYDRRRPADDILRYGVVADPVAGPGEKSAAVTDVGDCLRDGGLRPRVGLVLPLARTAEAQRAVESGAVGGRVLISTADGESKDN